MHEYNEYVSLESDHNQAMVHRLYSSVWAILYEISNNTIDILYILDIWLSNFKVISECVLY